MSDLKRSSIRIAGFRNTEMDFQLLRQLGSAVYGGASIGECLAVATKIHDGFPADWVREFHLLAERQERDASGRAAKRNSVSARDQYFMACNSYRAAEYYAPCLSDEHKLLGFKSRECFIEAMKLGNYIFEEKMLPYKKDIQIPVYFICPDSKAAKRKTLLIVSGFDGTREEEFITRGMAALERGYNVLLFSGPGQMDTMRFFDHSSFIPDFENVVKVVLDWCCSRADVDINRIALMGVSFGGYFAVRACASETRIKALIANSPIIDLYAYMVAFVGPGLTDMKKEDDFTLNDIPGIPDSEIPPHLKEMARNLIIRFGRNSFMDVFVFLKEFSVTENISSITCPCLALAGEGEGSEPQRQHRAFCKGVSGEVKEFTFSAKDGADAHCQCGNLALSAAVAYDWLDEKFK